MKTNYLKFILLAVISTSQIRTIKAQESTIPCNTVENNEQLMLNNPALRQAYIDYNKELKEKMNQKSERSTAIYTVPMVFHIIHVNGAENIPDANVIAQVARLNTDYRKLNADITSCPAPFQAIAGDALIQFKLAQLDPNGNCTNGIDRIYSHKTFNAGDDAKLNQWPRDKYFNVWVINDIPSGASVGTILAYATFPSSVATFNYPSDGVIMRSDQCNGASRTLTHETGHWLSLEHTWGNTTVATTCGDDGVSDTPVTKGHFSTCPAYDSTCTPGVMENINNYMDYSSCTYMFTQGQVDKMRAALESSVAQRNNLWINSNLIATGTDGSVHPVCVPKPDFYANHYSVCPGGSILFSANILYGTPAPVGSLPALKWTFAGGSPSTSNSTSPSVTYSTPGEYAVTLWAQNVSGQDSVVKTNYISVSEPWATVSPGLSTDDFENSSLYYSRWHSEDLDANSRTWWLTNTASYSGNQSVYMNAYYNYPDDVDNLYSPSYDLSYVTSPVITFRCAAATKATIAVDMTDKLRVFASKDCGATWTPCGTALSGASFLNNGYHPEEFIPNATSQWALQSRPIPISFATSNTRFKFEYTAGVAGNDIYIDDINIVGVLGVGNTAIDETSVSLYPNPSNQSSTLSYHLNTKASTKIELIDVLGKKMMEIDNADQSEGDYSIALSKQELHLYNGIYFIRISVNNNIITKKLIITE